MSPERVAISHPSHNVGPSHIVGMKREALLDKVFRYHEETKHHFHRYARALGYMDWANQPDPFRRFQGAPVVLLPLLEADEEPRSPVYEDIYRRGAVPPQPITARSISRCLELALGLTAWKQYGEARWALRSNPSSGNLHPTEGYLLLPPVDEIGAVPALYHYAPKAHALERRAELSSEQWMTVMNGFPSRSFLMGLTSVHWREAWKYGERAFRYCQHDAGHAVGSARIAAATLGWRLLLLEGTSDDSIAALLGVSRTQDFAEAEREHPDCLMLVWAPEEGQEKESPLFVEETAADRLTGSPWTGRANRLSRENPIPWDIIDEVAAASWKSDTERTFVTVRFAPDPSPAAEASDGIGAEKPSAGTLIHQRRSAVALDGETAIAATTFYRMLARVMPGAGRPIVERPMPWDALPWEPRVHLALFVHRVIGVPPGLYVLVRDATKTEWVRSVLQGDFLWRMPPGCPSELPLYGLQEGDARKVAAQVSCHQEIAGDGAFSLGMLAEFDSTLRLGGPWIYRRLYWETGVIGQVLYLEAEAAGVRATGIGCFFDDPVHQFLGVRDHAVQSLYHFTVGGPVADTRLTTLPPYEETGRG